jgi:hypothetical protein
MFTASHIANALSAAAGRFDRPSGRLPVGAPGNWVVPGMTITRCEQRSTLKPD